MDEAQGEISVAGHRSRHRDFARDPVSWAAHAYLPMETMSIAS
jgi:hypothetical protein